MRAAFDEIMRFWYDRGVAGFRIDVCNVIIKDALLRDNPAATEDDDFEAQMFGQRSVYNANRPEVHDVHPALADPGRHLRRAPGAHRARRRCRSTSLAGLLRQRPRRVASGLQLPLHQRALRGRRRCGPSSRRPRRPCRPGPGRPGRARTTTCSASPPAGPATTRARRGPPSSCCSACAARRSSTRATRSACSMPP